MSVGRGKFLRVRGCCSREVVREVISRHYWGKCLPRRRATRGSVAGPIQPHVLLEMGQ